MRILVTMFINLWISAFAWGWGDLGHRVIAEYGTDLVEPQILKNCHITASQIVSHTNDPDKIWRQQRRKYPHENVAHFFHVDRQPSDWRKRSAAKDRDQGFLVYRIVSWIEEAKTARKKQDWSKLAQKLYGLSHYLGDLTQPLHLHHDYDGRSAGLPDLHSQFETKLLNRYEEEVRTAVQGRLRAEKIPVHWSSLQLKNLIFDTAQQSFAKTERLFSSARLALQMPKSKKTRSKRKQKAKPRFVKAELWKGTGELAIDQLALGARLWAHALSEVCK